MGVSVPAWHGRAECDHFGGVHLQSLPTGGPGPSREHQNPLARCGSPSSQLRQKQLNTHGSGSLAAGAARAVGVCGGSGGGGGRRGRRGRRSCGSSIAYPVGRIRHLKRQLVVQNSNIWWRGCANIGTAEFEGTRRERGFERHLPGWPSPGTWRSVLVGFRSQGHSGRELRAQKS